MSCKPASVLSCVGRLESGIHRQNTGLCGDNVYNLHHAGDLLDPSRYLLDDLVAGLPRTGHAGGQAIPSAAFIDIRAVATSLFSFLGRVVTYSRSSP